MKTKDYALMHEPTSREGNYGSAVKKYKMTTEIPDGIASPDVVESRFGTLKFFDGFPDHPFRTCELKSKP